MKIVFITNDDQVNRSVLEGIAKSFPPTKTFCFFWTSSPSKNKRPFFKRVIGLLNALTRKRLDARRTKLVSQRLETGTAAFPNEQRIATKVANTKATAEMLSAL